MSEPESQVEEVTDPPPQPPVQELSVDEVRVFKIYQPILWFSPSPYKTCILLCISVYYMYLAA